MVEIRDEEETPEVLSEDCWRARVSSVDNAVTPKMASDTVMGLLIHMNVLACGALGAGVLWVSAAAVQMPVDYSIRDDSSYVDDQTVTIPVIASTMNSPGARRTVAPPKVKPLRLEPPPDVDVPVTVPLVPSPPPMICIGGSCSGGVTLPMPGAPH
jgi:hypothetical protein